MRNGEVAAGRACDDAWRRVRAPMVAMSTTLESPGRDEQNRLVIGQSTNSSDRSDGGDDNEW
ncbi:hypothetical protein DEO72_LG11g1111 [Vigna unguiculata]|uniref:Uncharacterized protein n=1 Tax=Vigna unguiculata TaxID=3917 RepID=A0A4D6NK01_VIGUN|nr:hypothetical protein DEO72_LG11g1111 [Vigna unguiculata]